MGFSAVRHLRSPARRPLDPPPAPRADAVLARLAEAFAGTAAGLHVEEDHAPIMAARGAFLARLHHRTRTVTLNGPYLASAAHPDRARTFLVAHEWLHAVRAGLVGDGAVRRDAARLVGIAGTEEAAADRAGHFIAARLHREPPHDA